MNAPRIIISGGGTGGHIFPAIAIAKAIQSIRPEAEILFVGAEGKMEMEKVPAAGFRIVGLPIVGIQRRLTWKNLLVPFKLLASLSRARKLIREFRPDVAIGVGGYASGPLLRVASSTGIPCLIQEQNSYAGVTNKLLSKQARIICVAYDGMEKFFASEKIRLTGNPVRPEIAHSTVTTQESLAFFNLDPDKKVILIIGGSLGARTINEAVEQHARSWTEAGFQVIWQTGKSFFPRAQAMASANPAIHAYDFIREMDKAYQAASLIVSRAGAMSISELCIVGKPAVLIPSPNVAEDHQTKNAMALVTKNAAALVRDSEAVATLGAEVLRLMKTPDELSAMSGNIRALAKKDAANEIAELVLGLIH